MNTSLKIILWRTSIAVAIIAIVVSFFYSEENSRGLAAWQKVEREAVTRGESLNWNDYIPPPVPDANNFFKAPMMTEWFVWTTNTLAADAFRALLENPENTTNVITEIPASNYLAWCATLEPQFHQIDNALKLPAARIDRNYSDALYAYQTPDLTSFRILGVVLAHRAKCHLLLGEPDRALEDLTQLHDLNSIFVKNGMTVFHLSVLMHLVLAGLYADTVNCGLDSHTWREPQLVEIQKQLAEIDLMAAFLSSLRCECASQCHLLEVISPNELVRRGTGPRSPSDLGWWLMPNGWIAQNKAVLVTLDDQITGCFDATNRTVSPYKSKMAETARNRLLNPRTPYNYIAAFIVPSFAKLVPYVGRQQTWVDQAKIACALERYRLANGKCPTVLTDLVPQYLDKIPHDVITGTPMKYTRKGDQNFLLYSVGWNETDEGGITVRDRDGNEDRESGDWVWHYPE